MHRRAAPRSALQERTHRQLYGVATRRVAVLFTLLAAALLASACQVDIVMVDVAAVSIDPSDLTLEPGESRQLEAILIAEDGQELTSRNVQWSTSDPDVVLVREDGRITALASGDAEITAVVNGAEGTAAIRVVLPPATLVAPAAPSRLEARAKKQDRIDLSWRDNASTETRYIVQRRRGESGDWSDLKQLSPNTTSYSDRGLKKDTRYWYRVIACNDAGCAGSGAVDVKTGG